MAAGPDGPLLEGSQPSSPQGGRALLSVVGDIVLAGFQAVSLTADLTDTEPADCFVTFLLQLI